MALSVVINAVDRTSYLERESLRINQDAATYVSTCYLTLLDPSHLLTVTVKDTIVVSDPALGITYFDGTVANTDYTSIGGVSRRLKLQCQDNNILVEEAVMGGPHVFVGIADNAIIANLFGIYLPAFDSATNVNLVDAAVTITFQNVTLREAMKQLCDQTDGFWFVRGSDLYYGVEADFGLVGWDLSDTPDNVNSFGYLRDASRKYHASNMVNRVTVFGVGAAAIGITSWDAASEGVYGTHAAFVTDNRISTVAGGTKRGNAILSEWSMPRESHVVKTYQGGAIAGQRIRYINSVYGVNAVFTIRRLSISFPADVALHTLTLGDDLDLGLLGQRIFLSKIEELLEPITPIDLPLSSLGWSHNIVFTPTAFDLVVWAGGGAITAADGTVYNINAGTTPNMGAATVYYIYLDLAISPVALQWSAAAATAVGANKLLVAVCYPSTDVTTDASVQVMAGSGGSCGVFINADNVAANCITAGLIFANTITAGCMAVGSIATAALQAGAITTITIAAEAVTADKLQIGEMFFNDAEGLLLLGPHCEINTTEWWSLRRQGVTLSGAFHQEAGRWIDTRGLVVEPGMTNLIKNPSFEVNITDQWAYSGAAGQSHNSSHYRYGSHSLLLQTTLIGQCAYDIVTDVTAAGSQYTFSAWVRGNGQVRLAFWDDIDGYTFGTTVTNSSVWQRLTLTNTFNAGSTNRQVYLRVLTSPSTVYYDAVQLEASAYHTSYCDGSLGAGYAWTGAVHNSTSTRTVTRVNLDAHVGLVSGNNTSSFRTVVQMPYDADDANWSSNFPYVWDIRTDDTHRIILYYLLATDTFNVSINGADRLSSSAQTTKWDAGDWLDLVVTIDFAADSYELYINGVLEDTDTTALVAPALLDWNLGSDIAGAEQGGFAFSEYAVFDRVLTAVEVAQMYNLQRPLVDAGAMDSPGIYIYDGRFRIASSTTGNRIEITADEIAGYNSAGVKQFYLQSSDGKAVAGAGAVILDASGVTLSAVDAATSRVKWDVAGATLARIGAFQWGGHNWLWLQDEVPTANTISNLIELNARAFGVLDEARIELRSERVGVSGRITLHVVGSVKLELIDGYVKVQEDVRIGGGLYVGATNINPDIDDIWCEGEVSTDGGATRWHLGGHAAAGDAVSNGFVTVVINGAVYHLSTR